MRGLSVYATISHILQFFHDIYARLKFLYDLIANGGIFLISSFLSKIRKLIIGSIPDSQNLMIRCGWGITQIIGKHGLVSFSNWLERIWK